MLSISTSFGDSWIAGTHMRNKEKTSTRCNRNTQKTSSCVTLTRRAHLTEKTDVQSPGTDVHKMEAHLAVSWMKGGAIGGTQGSAEPRGRSKPIWSQTARALAGRSPPPSQRRFLMFPDLFPRKPTSLGYKRGLPHPSQHNTLWREGEGESPP